MKLEELKKILAENEKINVTRDTGDSILKELTQIGVMLLFICETIDKIDRPKMGEQW